MIPRAEEIIAGYRFAAQRWKLSGAASDAAVRAAVQDALELAEGEPDAEAAALFFAFARRPRPSPERGDSCRRSWR